MAVAASHPDFTNPFAEDICPKNSMSLIRTQAAGFTEPAGHNPESVPQNTPIPSSSTPPARSDAPKTLIFSAITSVTGLAQKTSSVRHAAATDAALVPRAFFASAPINRIEWLSGRSINAAHRMWALSDASRDNHFQQSSPERFCPVPAGICTGNRFISCAL